jgi:muconolactone D-isomerase
VDSSPQAVAATPVKESTRHSTPMEFLVEFEVNVPGGAPTSEVEVRKRAEAEAAARLVDEGHLVRLWMLPAAPGETKALGLYRADSQAQLTGLLVALPLYDWMRVTVTPLERHPNDPVPRATVSVAAAGSAACASSST